MGSRCLISYTFGSLPTGQRLRSKTLIIATLVVVLAAGAAGGTYAYDQGRSDEIGKGVSVGGISLDGLTAAQAHAKLDRLIVQPLERPIVVHHDRSTWSLGAREARIAVDVDAIVDHAMARSREGNVFSRTVRNVTGKSLDADLQPTVRFEDRAVIRMLDKIRKAIDRKPVDATRDARPRAASRRPTAAPASRSRPRRCTARSAARSSRRRPTARSSRTPASSIRR